MIWTMVQKIPYEELLTEHDVARILKLSVATIRRRRLLRQPPTWIKIGASVRYKPSSIAAFLAEVAPVDGRRPEAR
jgi:hypothetical protein